MSEHLIWWLAQEDIDLVARDDLSHIEKYIVDGIRKRRESNGKERLWVDPRFGQVSCYWDNEKPVCQIIKSVRAEGIVVTREDAAKLPKVGILTDLDCELVEE